MILHLRRPESEAKTDKEMLDVVEKVWSKGITEIEEGMVDRGVQISLADTHLEATSWDGIASELTLATKSQVQRTIQGTEPKQIGRLFWRDSFYLPIFLTFIWLLDIYFLHLRTMSFVMWWGEDHLWLWLFYVYILVFKRYIVSSTIFVDDWARGSLVLIGK